MITRLRLPNVGLVLTKDLLCSASRFESELTIRQSVEADIVGLRKLIDDTNMGRMNLESEIEALKEELIHLKKNHDNVSSHYRLYETPSHGRTWPNRDSRIHR